MSILNILKYPDKRLKILAKNVKTVDEKIKAIINDMADTMYYNKGIGLSATQVNINKRIITIDISENYNNLIILINPIIIKKTGFISLTEGCLSIPNFFFKISRFNKIKIKTLNINGKNKEINANGLLSVCIQHEIDHLNGILFIEYLPDNIQNKIKKFFTK